MSGLPAWLLTHTMTVEPYLGSSGTGPRYGPPVEVRCFADWGTRTARNREGRAVTATATVYAALNPGVEITPEARVTVQGRPVEVVTVLRRDGSGLPTPDHLEITCQ